MRPGRETDTKVAQEIFGFEVFVKNKVLHEKAPLGDRPLRKYTKEIEWAFEVARQARVSLIPIEGGQWFAFAANNQGWTSPQELTKVLESGDFAKCGASVGTDICEVICEAALVAVEKKKLLEQKDRENPEPVAIIDSEPPTLLM